MSTVVAFTPMRARHGRGPADVIPISSGRRSRGHPAENGPPEASVELAPPLRLTRRGRLVATLAVALLVMLAVATGVLLISHQALAGDGARAVPATYHVVLPGETLWSIAGQVAPDADRRDTIERLIEFNALSSPGLQAGQRIGIPGDPAGP